MWSFDFVVPQPKILLHTETMLTSAPPIETQAWFETLKTAP